MARVGKSSTGRVTWCIMGSVGRVEGLRAEQCFVVGLIVKLLFCCCFFKGDLSFFRRVLFKMKTC